MKRNLSFGKALAAGGVLLAAIILAGCGGKDLGGGLKKKDNWVDFGGEDSFTISTAQYICLPPSVPEGQYLWSLSLVAMTHNTMTSLLTISISFESFNGSPDGSYHILSVSDPNFTDKIESLYGDDNIANPASVMVTNANTLAGFDMDMYMLTGGTLTVDKKGDVWDLRIENGVANLVTGGATLDMSRSKTYSNRYRGPFALKN